MTARVLLQAVVGLLAIYHLAVGVASVVSLPATTRLIRGLYGAHLESTPQLRYAARMLGLYAMALGALLAPAAFDPPAHRGIIGVVAGLQIARAASRVVFRRDLAETFGVSSRRNAIAIAALLAEAVALLVGLALL